MNSFGNFFRKFANNSSADLAKSLAKRLSRNLTTDLTLKNLTLDRRIAAPAIVACGLAGLGIFAAFAQEGLGMARAERDAKAELIQRMSGGAQARGRTQTAASLRNPFIAAETATTAAAEIDQLVRAVVAKANGVVLSTQAAIELGTDARMRRIEIQATIEGQMETIQRALFNLETGAPVIFIDDFALQPVERGSSKKEKTQMPLLQASLTLSAFWRSGS